jgi:hypothetical protein
MADRRADGLRGESEARRDVGRPAAPRSTDLPGYRSPDGESCRDGSPSNRARSPYTRNDPRNGERGSLPLRPPAGGLTGGDSREPTGSLVQ